MSYGLARGLLFRLDAERAHNLTLASLRRAEFFGLSGLLADPPPALPVRVMGLEFPNPVGLAAGLDKNGECIDGLAALGFGFLEIGTVTPRPQRGNPKPRMFRLPERQAVINRLGFNNKGTNYLVRQVRRSRYEGILGINIGKNADTPNERAADDYLAGLKAVHPVASYVTVNISSPNTEGLRDLQQDRSLSELLERLLEERERLDQVSDRQVPLVVKVAPDLDHDSLDALAETLNRLPPDAVIATNTTVQRPGMEDVEAAREAGGLSGAPLFRTSTAVQRRLRERLSADIDLIGCGGITSAATAAAKFEAGADLVQFYTGMVFQGPGLVREAVEGAISACT